MRIAVRWSYLAHTITLGVGNAEAIVTGNIGVADIPVKSYVCSYGLFEDNEILGVRFSEAEAKGFCQSSSNKALEWTEDNEGVIYASNAAYYIQVFDS